MKIGSRTPWGKADRVELVAPGVERVCTPGHGGFKLDRARNAQVHEALRKPGGWYEEDCEYAIVVFTFTGLFASEVVTWAKQTLRDYWPDDYRLASGEEVTAANSRKLREVAFYTDNADRYVVTSAVGDWHPKVPKGYVGVYAARGSRFLSKGMLNPNEEKRFLVPEQEYRVPERAFGFLIDETKHTEWADHA